MKFEHCSKTGKIWWCFCSYEVPRLDWTRRPYFSTGSSLMQLSRCSLLFCCLFFPRSLRDTSASGGAWIQVTFTQTHTLWVVLILVESTLSFDAIRVPGLQRPHSSSAHLAGDAEEDALEHCAAARRRFRFGQRQRGNNHFINVKLQTICSRVL